jgi:preprotein translocase subunit SecA
MFVDLMHDIHSTFTERFLRAQLVFNAPPPPTDAGDGEGGPPRGPDGRARPAKRYNALGILEDVVDTPVEAADGNGVGEKEDAVIDVGPDEPPKKTQQVRADPLVVGAGRAKSLSQMAGGGGGNGGGRIPQDIDWTSVGRNDPCPCGSGKKFKKCHGANA